MFILDTSKSTCLTLSLTCMTRSGTKHEDVTFRCLTYSPTSIRSRSATTMHYRGNEMVRMVSKARATSRAVVLDEPLRWYVKGLGNELSR